MKIDNEETGGSESSNAKQNSEEDDSAGSAGMIQIELNGYQVLWSSLTSKRGSVGQSEGLLISRSSVRFRLKPENSNSHGFELHRSSIKDTKLLLIVINAIIIIIQGQQAKDKVHKIRD